MPLRTLLALALSVCASPTIPLADTPTYTCHDEVGEVPCASLYVTFVERRGQAEQLRIAPLSGGRGLTIPVPSSVDVASIKVHGRTVLVVTRERATEHERLNTVDLETQTLVPFLTFDANLRGGPWWTEDGRVVLLLDVVGSGETALVVEQHGDANLLTLHTFPTDQDYVQNDMRLIGAHAVYGMFTPQSKSHTLWSVPLDGTRPPVRLDLDVPTRGPLESWTLVGDKAVYRTYDATYTTTLDGEDATPSTPAATGLSAVATVATTTDGTRLLVSGDDASGSVIEVRSAVDAQRVVLARDMPDEPLVVWDLHPTENDGLLYQTWHHGPIAQLVRVDRLWTVPLTGGSPVALTEAWPFGPAGIDSVTTSPDGTHVLFTGSSPVRDGLAVFGGRTDGAATTAPMAGSLDGVRAHLTGFTPLWIDGHRAVVMVSQGRGADLHVVDAADPAATYALTSHTNTQSARWDVVTMPTRTNAVVFAGNLRDADHPEVFVVPWDGSAPPAPLLRDESPPDGVSHLTLVYLGE